MLRVYFRGADISFLPQYGLLDLLKWNTMSSDSGTPASWSEAELFGFLQLYILIRCGHSVTHRHTVELRTSQDTCGNNILCRIKGPLGHDLLECFVVSSAPMATCPLIMICQNALPIVMPRRSFKLQGLCWNFVTYELAWSALLRLFSHSPLWSLHFLSTNAYIN